MSAEKKTIEELILSKPITPEIVNRLFYVYNSDWNRYVSMIKRILNQSILSGAQDIKVLVDRIDSIPSCENENYEENLFTDEKKKIFCMWLFKSHILCLNADERIVGRKIEHDLPITFKVYFSNNMVGNINTSDNLEFKIKQATKLQDLIMKQLKPILEEFDFYIKPVGAFTSESEFDSFQISLGFNSYYSKSEDIYIKTFVKDIINDEKKLKEAKESLDQSTELFGLGKKKSNSIEDVHQLPGYRKDIIEKCHSMFINAWNYKAYKLPTDVGELEDKFENEYIGEELIKRKKECGYFEKIKEFEKFSYSEKIISGNKLMIFADGIFEFAYGQPTEFVGYNKTLNDISKRWEYRLKEKEKVVSQYLSKFYKNYEINTYVGTGDGDEGCVYPQYSITIPIAELEKPIKMSKEEVTNICKNCAKLLKDAFAKNGNPKGFKLYSESEIKEYIDEYVDNERNGIYIGEYDAWVFTGGKARDKDEYEKFTNMLIKIENTIKDLIKKSKCPYTISSEGGDWDDGFYEIYFSSKK